MECSSQFPLWPLECADYVGLTQIDNSPAPDLGVLSSIPFMSPMEALLATPASPILPGHAAVEGLSLSCTPGERKLGRVFATNEVSPSSEEQKELLC